MARERSRRRVERLMDEAKQVVTQQNLEIVRARGTAVLVLELENARTPTLLATAERTLCVSSTAPAELPSLAPSTAASTTQNDQPSFFANGRLQVNKLLGEGGGKKVYLAPGTRLDPAAALALIKTGGLDETSPRRIQGEVPAMGRLASH